MRTIVACVSLLSVCSCSGLDDLRQGDLDVPPAVILAAGHESDASLDQPLNDILELRVNGGFTQIDDDRVVQAIRAQTMRRSTTALPLIEKLINDPVQEVQIQALVALEEMDSKSSLPLIGEVALTHSLPNTREQAYHTFSALTGVPINFLDERKLKQVLAEL